MKGCVNIGNFEVSRLTGKKGYFYSGVTQEAKYKDLGYSRPE